MPRLEGDVFRFGTAISISSSPQAVNYPQFHVGLDAGLIEDAVPAC
ncbi:MAG: hypothetical protein HY056_17790 [Proteobacteria bacterium]|nr:hypothetical protein [Pseudomonadota bacterium]